MNTRAVVAYLQFDLSGLAASSVAGAELSLWKVDATAVGGLNSTITPSKFAAYGLGAGLPDAPPNTPQDWVQGDTQITGLDFTNAGEEWTDNSQLSNGLDPTRVVSLDPDESTQVEITESIAADTGAGPVKVTLAGPSLDAFLNARLASSDAPGLATFLLAINASNQGWGIASREHADLSLRPVLAIPDTSVLPGDYNGDTVVDARDYAVWRQAYSNAPGGPEAVHLNSAGDGLAGVDTGDYHHWLANYGATQTPSTPTPEPGALVLAALSCLGLSARRRRE